MILAVGQIGIYFFRMLRLYGLRYAMVLLAIMPDGGAEDVGSSRHSVACAS